MSINWTVRDLARALKQILVPVEKVMIGDILVDDFGVQQIARIQLEEGRTALYDADDNGGTFLPKMQVWIVDRDALAVASKPVAEDPKAAAWSQEPYEVLKVLLSAWLRREPPLLIAKLARRSGVDRSSVLSVIAWLETQDELHRDKQRAALIGLPRKSLGEIITLGAELRETHYYVDLSGRPSNTRDLIRRIQKAAPEVAIGGVCAARYYMPGFNLNGSPRVDVTVGPTDDLTWVTKVDPALTEASGASPGCVRLVVHRLMRPEPDFTRMPEGMFADPAEVLLDLYELRLIDQAEEFVAAREGAPR